jgi:hypothetical protein
MQVVPAFDVLEDCETGGRLGREGMPIEELAFVRREEDGCSSTFSALTHLRDAPPYLLRVRSRVGVSPYMCDR